MRFDPQRAIAPRHAARRESPQGWGGLLSDSTEIFREILHWTLLLTMSMGASIAIGDAVVRSVPLNGIVLLFAIGAGGVAAVPALLLTVPFLWGVNRWRAAAIVFPTCLIGAFWLPFITEAYVVLMIAPFLSILACPLFLSLLVCALCPWVKRDPEGTFGSRSALRRGTSTTLREGWIQ